MSRQGIQSGKQSDYVQDVYVYHLVNAATALARSDGGEVGSHNPVQDVTVGFGPDRPRMYVYCKEAPGSVLFTDPAAENEGDLDSLPETEDFGHRLFSENERGEFLRAQGPTPATQTSQSPTGCPVHY